MSKVGDVEIEMWDLFKNGYTPREIGEILDIDDHDWILWVILDRIQRDH